MIDAAPQLAINAAGDGVAVWPRPVQPGGAATELLASSLHAGRWSAPQQVRRSEGATEVPKVGIDAAGHVVVAWRDSGLDNVDGQRYAMWSARGVRLADGSLLWSGAVKLPATASAERSHTLVVTPNGTAVLAWRERESAQSLRSTLAVAEGDGAQWLPVQTLLTPTGDVDQLQLAAGAGGGVLMVWHQDSASEGSQVMASRRTGQGAWTQALTLSEPGGNPAAVAFKPRAALAGDGRALVVWQQNLGQLSSLWSRAAAADGSWTTPVRLLADEARRLEAFDLAMNAQGRAVLAWVDATGGLSRSYVRSFDAAAMRWAADQLVADEHMPADGEPQVALDALGQATVVWIRSLAQTDVFARRLDAADRWIDAPQRLDSPQPDPAYSVRLACASSGRCEAVWTQFSGTVGGVWHASAP